MKSPWQCGTLEVAFVESASAKNGLDLLKWDFNTALESSDNVLSLEWDLVKRPLKVPMALALWSRGRADNLKDRGSIPA